MKCPTDDTLLQISERQGIEIDYCPSCRGVWLDRGELDKLIERSANEVAARPGRVHPWQNPPPRPRRRRPGTRLRQQFRQEAQEGIVPQ